MSYGFMVWAVDTNQLKQAAGSKDETLLRTIAERFASDFAQLDDIFEDSELSAYEALRQIIDGTIPERARGSLYAYAFECLVSHFGASLDNSAVMPWSRPDFEPVDRALEAMGAPFKMGALYDFNLPVELPYPDDFPLTGWVSAATVTTIHEAFGKSPSVEMDAQTAGIVKCIRSWFHTAATKGTGVMSYYH
jgi:hypothetical protein